MLKRTRRSPSPATSSARKRARSQRAASTLTPPTRASRRITERISSRHHGLFASYSEHGDDSEADEYNESGQSSEEDELSEMAGSDSDDDDSGAKRRVLSQAYIHESDEDDAQEPEPRWIDVVLSDDGTCEPTTITYDKTSHDPRKLVLDLAAAMLSAIDAMKHVGRLGTSDDDEDDNVEKQAVYATLRVLECLRCQLVMALVSKREHAEGVSTWDRIWLDDMDTMFAVSELLFDFGNPAGPSLGWLTLLDSLTDLRRSFFEYFRDEAFPDDCFLDSCVILYSQWREVTRLNIAIINFCRPAHRPLDLMRIPGRERLLGDVPRKEQPVTKVLSLLITMVQGYSIGNSGHHLGFLNYIGRSAARIHDILHEGRSTLDPPILHDSMAIYERAFIVQLLRTASVYADQLWKEGDRPYTVKLVRRDCEVAIDLLEMAIKRKLDTMRHLLQCFQPPARSYDVPDDLQRLPSNATLQDETDQPTTPVVEPMAQKNRTRVPLPMQRLEKRKGFKQITGERHDRGQIYEAMIARRIDPAYDIRDYKFVSVDLLIDMERTVEATSVNVEEVFVDTDLHKLERQVLRAALEEVSPVLANSLDTFYHSFVDWPVSREPPAWSRFPWPTVHPDLREKWLHMVQITAAEFSVHNTSGKTPLFSERHFVAPNASIDAPLGIFSSYPTFRCGVDNLEFGSVIDNRNDCLQLLLAKLKLKLGSSVSLNNVAMFDMAPLRLQRKKTTQTFPEILRDKPRTLAAMRSYFDAAMDLQRTPVWIAVGTEAASWVRARYDPRCWVTVSLNKVNLLGKNCRDTYIELIPGTTTIKRIYFLCWHPEAFIRPPRRSKGSMASSSGLDSRVTLDRQPNAHRVACDMAFNMAASLLPRHLPHPRHDFFTLHRGRLSRSKLAAYGILDIDPLSRTMLARRAEHLTGGRLLKSQIPRDLHQYLPANSDEDQDSLMDTIFERQLIYYLSFHDKWESKDFIADKTQPQTVDRIRLDRERLHVKRKHGARSEIASSSDMHQLLERRFRKGNELSFKDRIVAELDRLEELGMGPEDTAGDRLTSLAVAMLRSMEWKGDRRYGFDEQRLLEQLQQSQMSEPSKDHDGFMVAAKLNYALVILTDSGDVIAWDVAEIGYPVRGLLIVHYAAGLYASIGNSTTQPITITKQAMGTRGPWVKQVRTPTRIGLLRR